VYNKLGWNLIIMDSSEKQKLELAELIKGSPSFSEDEKRRLLEKLPTLDAKKTKEATELLGVERIQWEKQRNDQQNQIQYFPKFVQASKREVDKKLREFAREKERDESETEKMGAQNLIKNI
jgi:hypothetical protein